MSMLDDLYTQLMEDYHRGLNANNWFGQRPVLRLQKVVLWKLSNAYHETGEHAANDSQSGWATHRAYTPCKLRLNALLNARTTGI
jgi:hypothetical protein